VADFVVTPRLNRTWAVIRRNGTRPKSIHATRIEAQTAAVRYARATGGGVVETYGVDGAVAASVDARSARR
jgi:hypothetical protein